MTNKINNLSASAAGAGSEQQGVTSIKTWQERSGMREFILPKDAAPYMVAEIRDLRAALARAPLPSQEPVAAQFKMPGETWEECSIDEEEVMLRHGYKFRYLYAAPAQPVEDARDAARYRVLREHVSPAAVRISMRTIPPQDQSCEERIDALCDQLVDGRAAMSASRPDDKGAGHE